MNMELQQPADNQAETDDLDELRSQADSLGIKYHPATGADKLKAKIAAHINAEAAAAAPQEVAPITQAQFEEEQFKLRKGNAGKLVRVRVTCMNPAKKEWDGEIISVGSAKIGTYKKFVKFNTENGWHIPFIIYEYMKEKKCAVYYNVETQGGKKIRKSRSVNEFSIEILPELTDEELKALARQQAMEAGKDV